MTSRIGIPIFRKTFKELGEGVVSKKMEAKIKKESNDIYTKGIESYDKINKYANENYDRLNKNVTQNPDTYIGGKKRKKTKGRKTRRRKTKRNRNN
jgi:hypothetical protein